MAKRPPCSLLIIENKIKRVVVGIQDPFGLVDGKGIQQLESAGIETAVGVLPDECYHLNRAFFKSIEKNRPYIVLKWAKDSNENIARTDSIQHWITQPSTKRLTHLLRSTYQAIWVGNNTILADNPSLDNRHFYGNSPIKIIVDEHQKIAIDSKVFQNGRVVYITASPRTIPKNTELIITNDFSLNNLLAILFKLEIKSIFVEGGKKLLEKFIQENYWDEAWVYSGTNNISEGILAPKIKAKVVHSFFINTDKIEVFLNP